MISGCFSCSLGTVPSLPHVGLDIMHGSGYESPPHFYCPRLEAAVKMVSLMEKHPPPPTHLFAPSPNNAPPPFWPTPKVVCQGRKNTGKKTQKLKEVCRRWRQSGSTRERWIVWHLACLDFIVRMKCNAFSLVGFCVFRSKRWGNFFNVKLQLEVADGAKDPETDEAT